MGRNCTSAHRDQSGQAHAADGGAIHFRIFFGGANHPRTVGANQLKAGNMIAEGCGDVMIFAMHVIRNRSADGDIFCAGSDGQEPAARDGKLQDLIQRDPAFASQQAGGRLKVQKAIQAQGREHRTAFQQTDIAIAASHADSQNGWRKTRSTRIFIRPEKRLHATVQLGIAPP